MATVKAWLLSTVILLLLLFHPTLGGAMELVALPPQKGVWSYEVRNGGSDHVSSVMIEHKLGAPVKADAPKGWSILANNKDNVTWIADKGNSIPPNGDLAGFSIQSNSVTANVVIYALTGTNGSLRTGTVPVPAN